MTWLLHENLIDGELDNQFPGWVSGWMRLYRRGQATLLAAVWLQGGFHIDVEGKVLRLSVGGQQSTAVDSAAIQKPPISTASNKFQQDQQKPLSQGLALRT